MRAESRVNSPPKRIFFTQSGSSTAKVKHFAKSMVPEPEGVGVARVGMVGLASSQVGRRYTPARGGSNRGRLRHQPPQAEGGQAGEARPQSEGGGRPVDLPEQARDEARGEQHG